MKRAVVTGGSGLIGKALIEQLIAHPEIGTIISLVRRPGGRTHEKLEERVIDFDQLPGNLAGLEADCAFCCLGTTLRIAGSKERQYEIDHDYVVRFAESCSNAEVPVFAVASSIGASAGSTSFYLRTKGEMERDCTALDFPKIVLMRPSLLLGNRVGRRFSEKAITAVMKGLAFLMIGRFRKYRPIHVERVARRMIAEALSPGDGGIHILESDKI
jgi:uncharacterized protein YbjT (DUF2867 family)